MSKPEIPIEFANLEEFVQEFENNLRHGGTFARGVTGLEKSTEREISIIHPVHGAKLCLAAKVVLVVEGGEGEGVGIAIANFDAKVREEIAEFLKSEAAEPEEDKKTTKNVHERLRGLPASEQYKIARGRNLNERIVLERIYGKAVWEPLLRNPNVTIPEVSRIARMGALPRPLLDLIVSNSTWLTAPHVRRALLANPRLGGEMVNKILRMMPRSELKLVPKQTTYSTAVRMAARKIVQT